MKDLFAKSEPKTLRPHQRKALDMLRKSAGSGNKRVVIQGPTGFGKTLLAAKIIEGAREKGRSVIFTAPAISLIDQTVEAFEAEGIEGIGVMQAKHPRTNPMAPVQIASVQTLARREIPSAALIIVDECHLQHQVILDLLAERTDVYFVGLSATPWAKGMAHHWDDLVIPVSLSELIEDGYLSEFRVFAPDDPDMSGVPTRGGDFAEGDTERVMSSRKIVANVVETWLEKGGDRPTLLFAVNRAHAAVLAEAFEAAGVASAYVDANTDMVERKVIERDFRAGEVKVACSVRTLTTGVDWPVSCIIDAAPTKSEMLHVQKIGRGLRVNDGTEDLLILDHAGNTLRLGMVTDILHEKLDDTEPGKPQAKARPKRLPVECVKCGEVYSGLTCPGCGNVRKPRVGVETVEGDLIEVTPGGKKKAEPTREDKQRFWSMALHLSKKRGRGDRLAKGLYRAKFGVWPQGLSHDLLPPDREFMNYEKSRRIAYAKSKARKEGRP